MLKYLGTKGRIGRVEFVLWTIITIIIGSTLSLVLKNQSTILYSIIALYIFYSIQSAKRYHDLDKWGINGFVWLIIPIINIFYFLELCLKKGTIGFNKYGKPSDFKINFKIKTLFNPNKIEGINYKSLKKDISIEYGGYKRDNSIIPEIGNISSEKKKYLIERLAEGDLFSYNGHDMSMLDELFDEAARYIVTNQLGSISFIQRRFSIGYNRAGRIMDQLEDAKIVSPFEGNTARQVLIKNEYSLEHHLKTIHLNKDWIKSFYEENKLEIESKREDISKLKQQKNDMEEKESIKQKIIEKERKKRLRQEALKELIADGLISNKFVNKEGKRESIPQEIMDKVWNRDGGKCVKCGSQENLEFDHIIPVSKGGATSYRNIQLLCKKCNLEKSNKIG